MTLKGLTLYDFKVNDTTLEYFKVNIHGSGNSYKQFYDISRKYYRIVQEGIVFNEDYSF